MPKETALTTQHNDLTIRPITGPDELDLFNRFPYRLNEELAADLDKGHRRPEWLWLALRDGRLAARAGWGPGPVTSTRSSSTSSTSMTPAGQKPWASRRGCSGPP